MITGDWVEMRFYSTEEGEPEVELIRAPIQVGACGREIDVK